MNFNSMVFTNFIGLLRRVNVLSITAGFLVIQGVALSLSFIFIVWIFVVYKTESMVALFYPSTVLVLIVLGITSKASGGYVCMLFPKRSLTNPVLLGVLLVGMVVWLWLSADADLGSDVEIFLLIDCLLSVPATLLGAYFRLFQERRSNVSVLENQSNSVIE